MAWIGIASSAILAIIIELRKKGRGEEEGDVTFNVVCGTKNPGKIEATKKSLENWNFKNVNVEGIKVPSGVRDQPYGLDETRDGAMNRAKNAFEKSKKKVNLGVGLESGVLMDRKNDTLFDFCVCAIYDGEKFHVGYSGIFALPNVVKQNFEALGYNGSFKAAGVKPDDTGLGVLNFLSDGRLSRPSQTSQAFDYAIVSLNNRDSLYSR